MTATGTKQRVCRYLELYGTTKRFFAQANDLNPVYFGDWLQGRKEYSNTKLARMNAYIDRMAGNNV